MVSFESFTNTLSGVFARQKEMVAPMTQRSIALSS